MDRVLPKVPRLLAEITDVVGEPAAIAIARLYGGRRLKFPSPEAMGRNPARYEGNWLVQAVGFETAWKIVNELFPLGGNADIPLARSYLIWQYVRDNAGQLSISEMAQVLEASERTIRRAKQALHAEGLIA